MKTRWMIVALAAAATATRAEFAEVRFTGTGQGRAVQVESPVYSGIIFAGQLWHRVSDAPEAYLGAWITYCTDLAQRTPREPHEFEIVSLSLLPASDPMGAPKADAIRDLYAWAGGSQLLPSASSDYAAAFQLAIWEIVTDYNANAPGFGLDIRGGAFRATRTNGAPLSSGMANHLNTLFAAIGNAPASDIALMGLRSAEHQDQIIPVPAPGSAFLAAVGLLCLATRTRLR